MSIFDKNHKNAFTFVFAIILAVMLAMPAVAALEDADSDQLAADVFVEDTAPTDFLAEDLVGLDFESMDCDFQPDKSDFLEVDEGLEKDAESLLPEAAMATMSVAGASSGGGVAGAASGETYPDKFVNSSGAAYKIPIKVPPGRLGIAPVLALTYNSHKGNSWVGVGWGMHMGSVRRNIRDGLDYTENDFVFEKDGASIDLVDRSSDWGSDYFGARIEGSGGFVQFKKSGDSWIAYTKDGKKLYFGSSSDSRQCDGGTGFGDTFRWFLDKVEDTNGNYMTMTYDRDSESEVYLEKIEYTKHTDTSGLDNNEVIFYIEDRDDDICYSTPHFEVTTKKRLKTIEISANGNCVRAYSLTYAISERTGRSLLQAVAEYGNDATVNSTTGLITGGTSLPPIEFDYQNSDFGAVRNTINRQHRTAPNPYQGGYCDVNGDGRTDFVYREYQNHTFYALLGTETGGFVDTQLIQGVSNAATNPYEGGVGDFDGDGLADYVFRLNASGDFRILRSNGVGFDSEEYWGHRTQPLSNAPLRGFGDFNGDGKLDYYYFRSRNGDVYVLASSENGTANETRWLDFSGAGIGRPREWGVGDFNGDGMDDIVFRDSGNEFQVLRSTGTSFIKEVWYYNKYPYATEPAEVGFGDFNGDGLCDYMYKTQSGSTCYFWVMLSTGTSFTQELWYTRLGNVPDSSPYQGGFGDFNGDGCTDYMFKGQASSHNMSVMLSMGNLVNGVAGTGFEAPQIWGVSCAGGQDSIGDFDGDGLADYCVRDSGDYYKNYLTISTGSMPDLLSSVDNGAGGEIAFQYRPSSKYDNAVDVGDHDEYLPFVIQTVLEVSVDDGVEDPVATQFAYSGGYFQRDKWEFRGFDTISKANPDATTLTTSREVVDEWFKGRVLTRTLKTTGSTLLSQTTFGWDATGSASDDWRFIKLSQKRTELYDSSTIWSQEDSTYDSLGFVETKILSGSDGPTIKSTYDWDDFGSTNQLWRKTLEKSEELTGSPASYIQRARVDFDYEADTGNLTDQTLWLSGKTSPHLEFDYDIYGNLTHEYDANGNSPAITQYDTACRTFPVLVTNSAGHQEAYEYDKGFGVVTSYTDPNNNETTTQLDEFGRNEQVDYPDNGQALAQYHDDVFPRYIKTSIKYSAGNFGDTYIYYDGQGKEIQAITNGQDNYIVSQNQYDNMGRLELSTGPFFNASVAYPITAPAASPYVETQYDNRGRVVSIKTPNAAGTSEAETTYSYEDLTTTIIDPDSKKTSEQMDYLGRVVEVVEDPDNLEFTTAYEYDILGNVTKITDDLGNDFTYQFDTLSRMTSADDPDSGAWTYNYDANGNIISQTDGLSQTIIFAYDELNRLESKTYASLPDSSVTYGYDSLACANGIGNAYTITKGAITTRYGSYDEMGRVEEFTRIIPGITNQATSYTYDLAGTTTQITYPDNYVVNYELYAHTPLIYRVTGTGNTIHAEFDDYEPTGKPGFIDFANNAYSQYDYNAYTTRLESIQTVISGTLEQEYDYTYTDAGDISTIIDQKRSKTYNYTYDDLHRLLSETCSGCQDNMSLTYDALGNILTKTVGADALAYAYLMNGATRTHRLNTVTFNSTPYAFTHDLNGNMTTGWDFSDTSNIISRTLSYNADNMPITVTAGLETAAFIYDGDGIRTIKSVQSGATTYYISDDYEIIGAETTKYIFAGNMRVAKITGNNTFYLHQDHLGSSTLVSESGGALEETSDYRPFGAERFHLGNRIANYKYTDQEFDGESGLYNYNARLYDPILGRFVSADPLIPGIYDPQNLNPYAYCRNNPLVYTDPSGNVSFNADGIMSSGVDDYLAVQYLLQSDINYAWNTGQYGPAATGSLLWAANFLCIQPFAYSFDFVVGSSYNAGAVPTADLIAGNYDEAREGYLYLLADVLLGKLASLRAPATTPNIATISDDLGEAAAKKPIHKNSLAYEGETHVYRVKNPDGATYKIGESAQGTRVRDNASIRAERQVRELNRELGPGHSSDIRITFPNKAAAREYETKLIKRYRRMYGQDTLPGNKTNR